MGIQGLWSQEAPDIVRGYKCPSEEYLRWLIIRRETIIGWSCPRSSKEKVGVWHCHWRMDSPLHNREPRRPTVTYLCSLELPANQSLSYVGAVLACVLGKHESQKGNRVTVWPWRAVAAARLGKTKSLQTGLMARRTHWFQLLYQDCVPMKCCHLFILIYSQPYIFSQVAIQQMPSPRGRTTVQVQWCFFYCLETFHGFQG